VAAVLAWGCGQAGSAGGGKLTTGKTVRQERFDVARGLGGYRSVEMPERARRHLVEADPKAPGVAAYERSVGMQ